METFVNNAITNGIVAYFGNNNMINAHVLEMQVIKVLATIYNETDIINPYKLKKEKSFKDNLTIYGFSSNEVEEFLLLFNSYDKWLNSRRKEANTVISRLFSLMMRMIVCKSHHIKIDNEELKIYDNFFTLSDERIRRIVLMCQIEPEIIIKQWQLLKRRYILKQNKPLSWTEPKLLAESVYVKYGVSLAEVKQLSNQAIEEINKQILIEENSSGGQGGRKKEKPLQLILTSGNGFVDMLVLLSIMFTEIMIGIIITVTLMGR